MSYLSQFTISFAGLPLGEHHFEYDIDKKFFDNFEYSLVKDAQAKVSLRLNKHNNMLLLDFEISSNINSNCDRCLTECTLPFNSSNQLNVKFGDAGNDEPDEVILHENETEINLAPYICEYINLMLPLHIVACEITGDKKLCNQEVLQKLEQLKITEQEQQQSVDPRWAALSKLRNN